MEQVRSRYMVYKHTIVREESKDSLEWRNDSGLEFVFQNPHQMTKPAIEDPKHTHTHTHDLLNKKS